MILLVSFLTSVCWDLLQLQHSVPQGLEGMRINKAGPGTGQVSAGAGVGVCLQPQVGRPQIGGVCRHREMSTDMGQGSVLGTEWVSTGTEVSADTGRHSPDSSACSPGTF